MSEGSGMQGVYGINDGEKRICPECFVEFTPKQPTQRFHHQDCRLRSHHRKRLMGAADEQRSVKLAEEVIARLERIEKHLGLPSASVTVTIYDFEKLQAELLSEVA